MEEWRVIPGFERYEASSEGRVRRAATQRVMMPDALRGYQRVWLSKDGRTHCRQIHHLVLTAFVEPRPEGLICRHLNGVRHDNRVENLRWGTAVENWADMRAHGTAPCGERSGTSKLTDEQVRLIHFSSLTGVALSEVLGVAPSLINRIRRGEAWTHIGDRPASQPVRVQRRQIGTAHHQAKLTDEQVREIRVSPMGGRHLARQFGVNAKTIHNIRHGRIWKHIGTDQNPNSPAAQQVKQSAPPIISPATTTERDGGG